MSTLVSILPSLILREGKVVVLGKPDFAPLESQPEAARRDADEIAEHLGDKHGAVLAIDLDGIEKGEPNYDVIQDLGDVAPLWVDAGIVTEEEATDLIVAGADHVVIGSRSLDQSKLKDGLLGRVLELTENVVLGVHWESGVRASGGKVGWPESKSLAREAKDAGVAKAIFFDLDRARSSGTMNFAEIRDLVELGLTTFVAGGTKPEDREPLGRLGATGLVLDVLDVLRLEAKEHEGEDAKARTVGEGRTKERPRRTAEKVPSPMRSQAPAPWE